MVERGRGHYEVEGAVWERQPFGGADGEPQSRVVGRCGDVAMRRHGTDLNPVAMASAVVERWP
jgi:hypothetical protein